MCMFQRKKKRGGEYIGQGVCYSILLFLWANTWKKQLKGGKIYFVNGFRSSWQVGHGRAAHIRSDRK
jgi:hypothetical protein